MEVGPSPYSLNKNILGDVKVGDRVWYEDNLSNDVRPSLVLPGIDGVTLKDIEQAVVKFVNERNFLYLSKAVYFKIDAEYASNRTKKAPISVARSLSFILARSYIDLPWAEIGWHFGRRNHSTAISMTTKMVQDILFYDKVYEFNTLINYVKYFSESRKRRNARRAFPPKGEVHSRKKGGLLHKKAINPHRRAYAKV